MIAVGCTHDYKASDRGPIKHYITLKDNLYDNNDQAPICH